MKLYLRKEYIDTIITHQFDVFDIRFSSWYDSRYAPGNPPFSYEIGRIPHLDSHDMTEVILGEALWGYQGLVGVGL